jgi:large subunit ribosomal protein L30
MTRLRITYAKSAIGHNHRQKATIAALGFHKLYTSVEQPDNPSTWGMIRKVQHLVRVERFDEAGTE